MNINVSREDRALANRDYQQYQDVCTTDRGPTAGTIMAPVTLPHRLGITAMIIVICTMALTPPVSGFTCDTEDRSSSFLEVCSGEVGTVLVEESISSDEEDKTFTLEFIGPFSAPEGSVMSGVVNIVSPDASGTKNKHARSINSAAILMDGDGSTLAIDYSSAGTETFLASATATGGGGHKGQTNDGTKGKAGGRGGSVTGDISVSVQNLTLSAESLGSALQSSATGGAGGTGGKGDSDGSANAWGGDGGDGGNIEGGVSLSVEDTQLSASIFESALVVSAAGGEGGTGGTGNSWSGKGNSGDGGAGGTVSGPVSLRVLSSTIDITQMEDATAAAVSVSAMGGDGGRGGNAESWVGKANGGHGGDGGSSGQAVFYLGEVDNPADLSIQTEAGSIAAVRITAVGGDAGGGGSGDVTGRSGGNAGNGGDGGVSESVVLIVESGSTLTVSTSSDDAAAVEMTSLGGTGGKGRHSGDSRASDGGIGGSSEAVTLDLTDAVIQTLGTASTGIQTASLGGTGGAGGEDSNYRYRNGGDGGNGGDAGIASIFVETTSIQTGGSYSSGLVVETIGGDGGSAATGGQDTGGGNGGAGGDGGAIDVEIGSTDIETSGDQAVGMMFVNQGGGGGESRDGGDNGRAGSGLKIDVELDDVAITTSGAQAHGVLLRSNSGAGGLGGDGGDIDLLSRADIEAFGDGSAGILAQSIGGVAAIVDNLAVADSGESEYPGRSDDITIVHEGDITITGNASYGIMAESISAFSGDDSSAQIAGAIFIQAKGAISLTGTGSTAVHARSHGQDAAQPVQIFLSGSLSVTGDNSSAVFAENRSDNADVQSSISVYLTGNSTLTVAQNAGHGIELSGGLNNVIGINGTLERPDDGDMSGYAIHTSGAALTIANEGTIIGSVLADSEGGEYNNFLENSNVAIFEPGSAINLANVGERVGQLANYGTLSPGGTGTLQTTTYQGGKLLQLTSGVYETDLVMADSAAGTPSEADILQAAQSSFNLAGTVSVSPMGSLTVSDGESGSAEIARVADGDVSISELEVTDTATVDYSLSTSDIDEEVSIGGQIYNSYTAINLDYAIDLGGGLNALGYTNSAGFAGYWANILDTNLQSGAPTPDARADMTAINSAILLAPTQQALKTLYDHYTVDEAAVPVVSSIHSALDMVNRIQSCRGADLDPVNPVPGAQDCSSFRFFSRYGKQDETAASVGYSERSLGATGGVQREIAGDLYLELGGTIENLNLSGSNYTQDGNRYELAAALKREYGPLTLAATLGGGYYDLDHDRSYLTGPGTRSASSDVSGGYLAGELSASRTFARDNVYVTPIAALSLVHTRQQAFTEAGPGAVNWHVDQIRQTDLFARLMVEVGGSLDLFGTTGRAFMRPGLTAYLTDPVLSVNATLNGHGPDSLNSTFEDDRFFGEISFGYVANLRPSVWLSVEGTGIAGETFSSASGSFSLNLAF